MPGSHYRHCPSRRDWRQHMRPELARPMPNNESIQQPKTQPPKTAHRYHPFRLRSSRTGSNNRFRTEMSRSARSLGMRYRFKRVSRHPQTRYTSVILSPSRKQPPNNRAYHPQTPPTSRSHPQLRHTCLQRRTANNTMTKTSGAAYPSKQAPRF